MIYYTIYKTTNIINGEYYIGQHVTEDLNDDYLGSGTRIINSIQKYGRDSFKKDILYVFDNFLDMDSKEAEIVTPEFLKLPNVLNIIPGGSSGSKFTIVVSLKQSPEKFFRILKEDYDKNIHQTPTTGTVSIETENGKFKRISVEEYKSNTSQYTTISSGKLSVLEIETNTTKQILVSDYNEMIHKKVFGGVVIKDENGNTRYTTKGEYYSDNTLVHVHKNMVTVTDNHGVIKHITKEEFYNNRHLYKTLTQGKFTGKNKLTGQTKLVTKKDVENNREDWLIGTEGYRTVFDVLQNKFVNVKIEDYNEDIHKLAQDKKAICFNPDNTIRFCFWGNKIEFMKKFKCNQSVWAALTKETTFLCIRGKNLHFNGCYFKLINWKENL